jgi:inorganic triphosphatase YgiF
MEIEAKFAVPDQATWLKLQTVKKVAGYALSPGKMKRVHDTFMDTPDRAILASGHVCRKREVDWQIVMTLKGKQTVEGAVHRREELEITLERELPIGQWPPSEIRDRLLSIVGDVPLTPLFDPQRASCAGHAGRSSGGEMSVDKVELSLKGREQLLRSGVELKEVGTGGIWL